MSGTRADALALLQSASDDVMGDDGPRLTEEATLADIEIDSLDLVEIVMVVEEAEGYTIDAAEIETATCIADIIDVIMTKRASLTRAEQEAGA